MTNPHWRPASRKYGVAISSFTSPNVAHSLPLEIGETVHILEEYTPDGTTPTWYRGCSFNNKSRRGIFPCSFIHTKDSTVENEGPFETVTAVEDAIIKELTYVLREWNSRWKMLFVNRKMSLFQTIRLVMGQLDRLRSLLVTDTLTKEQALVIKHQVVTMIDWGNGNLGMDLVPRVDYQQADPETVSVVEMYRIHQRSVENCQGAWMMVKQQLPVNRPLSGGVISSLITQDMTTKPTVPIKDAKPGGKVSIKNRDAQREKIHHILVNLRSLSCSVGDNTEVLISLYDSGSSRFLSEKYVVYFNKDGVREGNAENDAITLFTDLSVEDTQNELYLVIQILRRGRLLMEGNFKKVPTFQYRRPWGVTVLCLRDLFQIKPEGGMEYSLRVQCIDSESQFSFFHEQLIKRHAQLIGRVGAVDKQSQDITISVKLLNGDLKYVKIDNPTLFSKGLVITQRMGFSDFINPGEGRNDLYLTLVGAELDRGSKTASKNVEVEVQVYNKDYERIQYCISYANGTQVTSSFNSYIFYHNNSPRWNETVRLSIPVEKFSTSHIHLKFSHCSNRDKTEKKLYGFSFLPVTTQDNVTRQDNKYELSIYKCNDPAKIKKYLHLPSLQDDFNDPAIMPTLPESMPFSHSSKEYFTVETSLCSTKFAQKSELLAVLQWNSKPVSRIPESLEKLLSLRGQDIVRYLEDILDALFHMFSAYEKSNMAYGLNIFQALTHIFNLLQEDTYEKFSCIKEDYLEKSFSSPMAHRNMMQGLKWKVEQIYSCIDFDEENETKQVFRVLEDVFKFSVKSCILSQRISKDQTVKEFRDNLNDVFDAFGKVLSSGERILINAQVQLLGNFHKTFAPLLQIVSSADLTCLLFNCINKISKEPGSNSNLLFGKTILIQNTINSPLFKDAESRSLLLPLILPHLKKCIIHKRELDISANTLGDLLSFFFTLKQDKVDVSDEITKIVQGLFDVIVRLLWKLWNGNEEQQRLKVGTMFTSCLMEMLRLMDVNHYQKLMSDYPKPGQLKDFVNRILLVFQKLIESTVFPTDWTSMRMITNNVMLTSIQYIAGDLADNFLKGNDFDQELWTNFFLLAVTFITQPALQLEKYSDAKRGQIKDKYCDMRVPVGCQMCSLWNQLGRNNQQLMMTLVGPFLKVSMVPENELRQATIPIFFNIIQTEFQCNKDLKRIEGKMIHELDSLVLEHNGDAEFKELFSKLLLEKIQTEPEMQEEGKRFVFSVTDLLERLLDYRDIMDGEEQRDTKMHCTFNILNFYKDSRKDMYIRYMSRLYELHYTASNFVEAGLTLKLYAQLLSWSDRMLPAEMSHPAQTERERKEALLTSIIDCFDKGYSWEYGIPLCKELAEHYENVFEYKRLGQILQKQASFFYHILEGSKVRHDPSYFRVAYYGNSFPPYLKNKAFVYRYDGSEFMQLATIRTQLGTEYPSATLMSTNSPLDESYKQGDAQHIQIVKVDAIASDRPDFAGKEVPIAISSFYKCNEVDTFKFDRPYYRDGKDSDNEFKNLCLERTIIKTSYKLPGILRWYEVVSAQVLMLNPVQQAIDTVQKMNLEIKTSTMDAQSNPEQFLSHLTMRLQGVINSVVNGGIPKYQEAFFNAEYKSKYPNEVVHIDELKYAILEQAHLLERALTVHGKIVSQDMQPLHKSLEETFSKIKGNMGYQSLHSKHRESLVSFGSSNQSQRPSTPSSTSLNSSGSNRSSTLSANEVIAYEDDHENYYTDVNEDVRLKPPPSYTKRRNGSMRINSFTNQTFQIGTNRPLSAIVTSSNQIQALAGERAESYPNLSVQDEDKPPLPPRKNSITSLSSDMLSPTPPPLPDRMTRGMMSVHGASDLRVPAALPKRSLSIKEEGMATSNTPRLPPKEVSLRSPPPPLTASPTARNVRTAAFTNSPTAAAEAPPIPVKRTQSVINGPHINVTGGSQRGVNILTILAPVSADVREDCIETDSSYNIPPPLSPRQKKRSESSPTPPPPPIRPKPQNPSKLSNNDGKDNIPGKIDRNILSASEAPKNYVPPAVAHLDQPPPIPQRKKSVQN